MTPNGAVTNVSGYVLRLETPCADEKSVQGVFGVPGGHTF